MKYVIGIDGGGTKTTGVIANSKGETFAEVTVGPSNPNSVARDQLKIVFTQLFNQLRELNVAAFEKVGHVFAGLSGADHLATRGEMKELIVSLLPKAVKVTIDNDAITALYSGTLGEPGIVQIAGTGAITYGVNSHGERKRAGGWGYLFSDHGSGYSLGRDALEAVFLSYDGFREYTLLSEKIKNYFHVDHIPDLIRVVYHQPGKRELIASLSRLVMEAADQEDKIALEIIDRNGKHLGKSIGLLIEQLFERGVYGIEAGQKNADRIKLIPVILVGGLFNRIDLLRNAIDMALGLNKDKVNLIVPEILPVGGAVIAALREDNVTVDEKFVENFKKR